MKRTPGGKMPPKVENIYIYIYVYIYKNIISC